MRVRVYRCLIFSRLTSGLSALVLNQSCLGRLESRHVSNLRVLMCGTAFGFSNAEVRATCDFCSVENFLWRARLRLWQKMAAKPASHVAASCVLAGSFEHLDPQLVGRRPGPFVQSLASSGLDRSVRLGFRKCPHSASSCCLWLARLTALSCFLEVGPAHASFI